MNNEKKMDLNEGLAYLKEMINQSYDEINALEILQSMTEKRVVSLRVNTLKTTKQEVKKILDKENIKYEDVSWYDDALVIFDSESALEKLNLYQEGHIYLQSLSSMIPPLILDPKPHTDILDMAAAPGGKTTEIAALTKNQAFITACEAHPIRAEKLKFNLLRQGAKNVSLLIKDAFKLDEFFRFDQIMLDAPCSGSGTVDLNDEKSYRYFSNKLVTKSVETQKNLLKKAIQLLKPGHEMVYSTCSILPIENEMVIMHILKSNQVEIVPLPDSFFKDMPLLPSKLEHAVVIKPTAYYEGFFICKLRKK